MFARRVKPTILNRPRCVGLCPDCLACTALVVVGLVDVIDGTPVGVTTAEVCTACGTRVIEPCS